MFWENLLYILPILVVTFYIYYERTYFYWKRRGIPQPTPLPIFGTFLYTLIYGAMPMDMSYWKRFGNIWGTYSASQPILTICEPEMIKQILIRDFSQFVNRRKVIGNHEVWSKNMFSAKDETWKRIRSIVSPTFTSGKLRGMSGLMLDSVDKLGEYFDKLATGGKPFDVKKVISGFTIDVIASTSFAINPDSNGSRETENPFVHHGMRLFKFNPFRILTLSFTPDWLKNALGFHLGFTPKHFNFFQYLMKNVIEERKQKGIRRNDLTQLMIDAIQEDDDLDKVNYDKLTATDDPEEKTKTNTSVPADKEVKTNDKKPVKTMTDNEIIAQSILFFIAGFETTATTLTNVLYEMAMNPELQEELREDLENRLANLSRDSEEYYQMVNSGSPLMNAFIKETLRKYPPVQRLQRICGKDNYMLGNIELSKGALIDIPVWAVHYNPAIYPEPERFNPFRFMGSEKNDACYLPFGDGPRNCIGMRFAYTEIKLFLANIVLNYRFLRAPSTPEKLRFTKLGVSASLPFELLIEKRVKSGL